MCQWCRFGVTVHSPLGELYHDKLASDIMRMNTDAPYMSPSAIADWEKEIYDTRAEKVYLEFSRMFKGESLPRECMHLHFKWHVVCSCISCSNASKLK